ncbi:MAG: type I 3-dehydroquinate dehydratase [Actinobacteria bacterium]|nr:type I 3-dehydroquinate dehydratase [Actinomycetota bacterium]
MVLPAQPPEVRGWTVGRSGPCVAVPFVDDASPDTVAEATRRGMDVAELRIDRFADTGDDHVVAVAERFAAVPTIGTIRSRAEGGSWDGTDARRLELFELLLPHVGIVDIELSSTDLADRVVTAAHAAGRGVIVSFHDFEHTPSPQELGRTITTARDNGADVVKIATTVEANDDLRTLARVLVDHDDTDLIVIGMGPLGVPSRVLFPFLGSRLTFAAFGEPSAPGQLELDDLVEALRLVSPGDATR